MNLTDRDLCVPSRWPSGAEAVTDPFLSISPLGLEAQPGCQPRRLSPRPKRLLGLWSLEIKRLVLFRVPLVEPSLQIGGCNQTSFLSCGDFAGLT
jgi:hypothetical protein